jgi:hypothetical protein
MPAGAAVFDDDAIWLAVTCRLDLNIGEPWTDP